MPLRAFFRTKFKPKTVEEARNVYTFFASKGELIEFKFSRDPDVKRTKDFGWISYKNSKITEQLFGNWFKIEPFNTEVFLERSDKEEKNKAKEDQSSTNISLPPMFGGFYLKDDEATSPSVLDQTSNNFIPISENNVTIEEAIEETIEASENKKEPSLTATTNFTEAIIENTTNIETKSYGAESQH